MGYTAFAAELFQCMAKSPKPSLDEPRNFTRGEIGILIYLHFVRDGASAGELSEYLSVSTGRIATALKGLEKKGFIIRRRDTTDKRRVIVCITDPGRKFVIEGHNKGIEMTEKYLRKLSEEEAEEFVRLVKLIIA